MQMFVTLSLHHAANADFFYNLSYMFVSTIWQASLSNACNSIVLFCLSTAFGGQDTGGKVKERYPESKSPVCKVCLFLYLAFLENRVCLPPVF